MSKKGLLRLIDICIGNGCVCIVSNKMNTNIKYYFMFFATGSQVATRLLTFVLSLVTARALSPASYGLVVVQFHLLNTSVLFLAREGFRRGCLRINANDVGAPSKIVTASLLAIPIGLVLILAFTTLIVFYTNSPAHDPVFFTALKIQGAAALIELLSEPFYNLATVNLKFGIRVWTEGAALLVKNFSILGFLKSSMNPALAFSWAQFLYAWILLVVYLLDYILEYKISTISQPRSSVGQNKLPKFQFDSPLLRISSIFAAQACGKLLLAEGSKAVLTVSTPLHEQGVYGLVTNLGSLVVRTLFQPYEEVAFVAFSRPPQKEGDLGIRERAKLLQVLCRFICLVGCFAAAFGPAYSHLALLILYGPKWANTEAPNALALYSIYVALLAVNGTLEAFVHAVADSRSLYKANIMLVTISIVHIGLSVLGVRHAGALGLLLADAANMIIRIVYCLSYISRFFRNVEDFRVSDLLPSRSTLTVLMLSFLLTIMSQAIIMPESSTLLQVCPQCSTAMTVLFSASSKTVESILATKSLKAALHISIGIVCLVSTLGIAFVKEKGIVLQAAHGFKRKRD